MYSVLSCFLFSATEKVPREAERVVRGPATGAARIRPRARPFAGKKRSPQASTDIFYADVLRTLASTGDLHWERFGCRLATRLSIRVGRASQAQGCVLWRVQASELNATSPTSWLSALDNLDANSTTEDAPMALQRALPT